MRASNQQTQPGAGGVRAGQTRRGQGKGNLFLFEWVHTTAVVGP